MAAKDEKSFGGIYGLAFIGAAVYFIQNSTSFWGGVLGFLKALVWPAVLMYKLLSSSRCNERFGAPAS